MSKIYFYNKLAGQKEEFDAYITNFQDGIKLTYENLEVGHAINPLQELKTLAREINLSFDVINVTKKEAIDNLRKVNFLYTLLYGVRDTGSNIIRANPEIFVLYENIICDHNVPNSSVVENAGLRCLIINLDVKFELDSGFYTSTLNLPPEVTDSTAYLTSTGTLVQIEEIQDFTELEQRKDLFIFPKLIKINMVLSVRTIDMPGMRSAGGGAPVLRGSTQYPYRYSQQTENPDQPTGAITPNPGSGTTTTPASSTGGTNTPGSPATASTRLPGGGPSGPITGDLTPAQNSQSQNAGMAITRPQKR